MSRALLPDELWVLILEKLSFKELVSPRLVCLQWNVLITDIIRRRARVKKHCGNLGFSDFFITHRWFGQNLLKNTQFKNAAFFKHDPNYFYKMKPFWSTVPEWRADWVIERPPVGTLGEIPLWVLNREGLHSMYELTCIANDCRKGNRQYQDILLSELGIKGAVMDQLQPTIVVEEWIGAGYDCQGCHYTIQLEVFDKSYTEKSVMDFPIILLWKK